MPRDASRHAQRGRSLGRCPDCDQEMWSDQRTTVVPIKIDGRFYGCLMHIDCADKDLRKP